MATIVVFVYIAIPYQNPHCVHVHSLCSLENPRENLLQVVLSQEYEYRFVVTAVQSKGDLPGYSPSTNPLKINLCVGPGKLSSMVHSLFTARKAPLFC